MTSDGSENNPNKTEKPATTTMTNSCTDDTNTFKPPPPAFAGEQGKRARFYRNGDQFFKGLWYTISSYRAWEALLQNLNQHLCDSISLPQGVRVIFTVDGRVVKTLEELEHGKSYVASSTEKFKAIDYANAAQPIWSFVSSKQLSNSPYYGGIRQTLPREPNEFVRPRIVTIIRNGMKPRRVVRHLLNKRTAQSFEHVMQDITAIVKLNSGVVRKLYTLSGKQVTCLADFFANDHVFVAYGQMDKISTDDFYVVSEEYRRMNVGKPCNVNGRLKLPSSDRKMPVRNDAFRKTLSPDPKAIMQQDVHLPEALRDRVKILQLLGDGNTALVFKAAIRDPWRADQAVTSFAAGPSGGGAELEANLTYSFDALKIIRKENVVEMMEFIRAEIDLMSAITHEHIVRLHDYQVVDDSYYIRMELLEGGDLFEYLRMQRTLCERDAASCIKCLSKALDYLHCNCIVHRDVKPENLLTNHLLLKLADFGLAVKCADSEPLYQLCGTPTYVAPEVLSLFGYSYKADCWSTGVILYILHCGFPPFGVEDDEALFDKIVRGHFDFPSPSFDNVSNAAKLLIRQLIATDPNGRFSAAQVLESPWIQQPGFTSAELEDGSALQLSELMVEFYEQNDFDGSESEYFYSRRASMDELSERSVSAVNPSDFGATENNASQNVSMEEEEHPHSLSLPSQFPQQQTFGEMKTSAGSGQQREEGPESGRVVVESLSRDLSQSSFIYVPNANASAHQTPPPQATKSSVGGGKNASNKESVTTNEEIIAFNSGSFTAEETTPTVTTTSTPRTDRSSFLPSNCSSSSKTTTPRRHQRPPPSSHSVISSTAAITTTPRRSSKTSGSGKNTSAAQQSSSPVHHASPLRVRMK